MPRPTTPLACALGLLARRDHTVAELTRKLGERSFPAAEIRAVVERLSSDGYLDDRRFALQFATQQLARGRMAGPRLRLELRRRGIADPLIAEALAAAEAEHTPAAALQSLFARRFPAFDAAAASDKERARVVRYLQARGFSLTAILDLLRRRSD